MTWTVLSIAILGVFNFALHRPVSLAVDRADNDAVIERDDRMAGEMPAFLATLGGRLTFVAEFAVLLAAMLLAANGWPDMAWAYLAYTALNALAAWLILKRRV